MAFLMEVYSNVAKSGDTKNALAATLKEMLTTMSFDDVTVSELASRCGINRQTFYYHFHDIYDLISWMFEREVNELSAHGSDDLQEGLVDLLCKLKEERATILGLTRSTRVTDLYRIVYGRCARLTRAAMKRNKLVSTLTDEDVDLMIEFYSAGFFRVSLSWLETGCKESPEDLAGRLFAIAPSYLTDGQ